MAHNSVPPGFVSRTSFMLKREKTAEETNSSNALVDASNEEPVQLDTTSDQSDLNTEESDSEHFNMDPPTKSCLPKGVTHGCPDCSGCLKVTGRWHPEEARTDVLQEAPLFYPTEELWKESWTQSTNGAKMISDSPGHVEGASDADKQRVISRIRQQVKARILHSSTSKQIKFKCSSNEIP